MLLPAHTRKITAPRLAPVVGRDPTPRRSLGRARCRCRRSRAPWSMSLSCVVFCQCHSGRVGADLGQWHADRGANLQHEIDARAAFQHALPVAAGDQVDLFRRATHVAHVARFVVVEARAVVGRTEGVRHFVKGVATRRSFDSEDVGAGDDFVQWSLPGLYLTHRSYRVATGTANAFKACSDSGLLPIEGWPPLLSCASAFAKCERRQRAATSASVSCAARTTASALMSNFL